MPRSKRQGDEQNGDPSYAAPRPTADELLAFGPRLNRAEVDFLKIDLETALTFTGIALQSTDSAKRGRNLQSARKAHDTVVRLIERVDLSDEDAQILAHKLKRLKSELRNLGEVF